MRLFFICIFSFSLVCHVAASSKVCIDSHCVDVEIANTKALRQRGLMYRSHLPENKGAFFIFDSEDFHSFWMKNTWIPLDIIWIDSTLRVVDIQSSVPPCRQRRCPSYWPSKKALYVLEINAGQVSKYDIKMGDKVTITGLKNEY